MSPSERDPDEGSGESAGLPIALIVSPASGRLRVLPPVRFRGGREWVEAGQPVADATVRITPGDVTSLTTDREGRFSFTATRGQGDHVALQAG